MEVVRTGIVGMGIGKPNGRAIARNPRARVVALCDLVSDRMAKFAEELPEPVAYYSDFRAMCRSPEIDAVFVGTPNQWHVPVALEAVRNGKHVLVTKPLADSVAAAAELVSAAEAAGVANMMSLSTRFADPVAYLGRLREEEFFGELYYAHASSIRRSGIPNWNPGFIRAGGGAFRDMGVHVLDAAWWLLGMPEPVSVLGTAGAKLGPRGLGFWDYKVPPEAHYAQYAADDYAGGFIRFANGAGMQVESFWASHQPESLQIDLFGSEAGARLRPLTLYRTVNGAPQDTTVEMPKGPEVWDRIAEHFVACILDGVPCLTPLRHGLLVQRMMEALLESAQNGHAVELDPM